ncbi:MAG: stage III sporulation protein AB [Oscillospiraceae bacterium]|nr:stage III sporulation protein AB [Oscillospiraceae bacterium]
MLKLFGMAVIIIVTTLTGSYFSYMLKSRVIMLKKLNYMLEEIMTLLRFSSATVYEIRDALCLDPRFSDLDFLQSISSENGVSFQENWCSAVKSCPLAGLKQGDTALLADIGRKLGTSDLDGQTGTLKLQQAELSSLISAAETEHAKKAKLYRSLGVLSGAFISIMLV